MAQRNTLKRNERLICGVRESLITDFLHLIRDNYRKADRAMFFMEEHAHLTSTASVANLRDVLSHLATLLDPKTLPKNHRAQLENAEEHLRRAILEPYLIVLGRESREFRVLCERYSEKLLPVKSQYPALSGAPGRETINATLRKVAKFAADGRAAKAMNLWNPHWERGVAKLLRAHVLLSELDAKVRGYWNQYQMIIGEDFRQKELEALRDLVRRSPAPPNESKDPPSLAASADPPNGLLHIISLAERHLRKVMRVKPDHEKQVQDAFEALLIGADADHKRELVRIEYSSKAYIPNFVIDGLSLTIELKLCSHDAKEKELIAEINDDILAYATRYRNLLFIVYDLGVIRDPERFTSSFEQHPNVLVRVVKH